MRPCAKKREIDGTLAEKLCCASLEHNSQYTISSPFRVAARSTSRTSWHLSRRAAPASWRTSAG